MIPWRAVKIKFFLSVVIYVVKAAFAPLSATGEKPAIARAARHCGISPYPVPDAATALPKYACGPRRSQWHNPTQPTSYAPYYNTLPTARRLWNGQKDLKGTAFSILLKYPTKSRADFWRKSVSQLGPFCVLFPAGANMSTWFNTYTNTIP